ncbi:hypothetical protein L227DRAFT_341620 [Lentinus tigrinus ALCF2SS1-6]|uniref:Uncharacterized protein n=1 Tax=Lentinus tigrinus ALCF2SS1-6 TaxID=1328759 RepID=A0A5C2RWI1_9APHY|nr:hypothetical protein L227DRAFT_341620 [Lentinus tigrinus ALCF2SS1-6]
MLLSPPFQLDSPQARTLRSRSPYWSQFHWGTSLLSVLSLSLPLHFAVTTPDFDASTSSAIGNPQTSSSSPRSSAHNAAIDLRRRVCGAFIRQALHWQQRNKGTSRGRAGFGPSWRRPFRGPRDKYLEGGKPTCA